MRISSAGEDAREPAGQADFPRSLIFGGFRRKRPTGAIVSCGCEAARAEGQGFVSKLSVFGVTHIQQRTDLVGGAANVVSIVATFPVRLSILRVVCGFCVLFPVPCIPNLNAPEFWGDFLLVIDPGSD